MGLLDGRLTAIAHREMRKHFLPATLHRSSRTETAGGDITTVWEDQPVLAQQDRCTQSMRESRHYSDKNIKIFVLQHDISPAPQDDDELSLPEGLSGVKRYAISMVSSDPSNTHWTMMGKPVGPNG